MNATQVYWLYMKTRYVMKCYEGKKITEKRYYELRDKLLEVAEQYKDKWELTQETERTLLEWISIYMVAAAVARDSDICL